MPRSRNNVASRKRSKRILKQAKGYWGSRGNLISIAKHAVDKANQYAYRDRRVKKRKFRSLWIIRVNAAARLHGTNYSKLMYNIRSKGILINRKVLADIAVRDKVAFAALVKEVI